MEDDLCSWMLMVMDHWLATMQRPNEMPIGLVIATVPVVPVVVAVVVDVESAEYSVSLLCYHDDIGSLFFFLWIERKQRISDSALQVRYQVRTAISIQYIYGH